jgi:putative N6-adenine-specific DNA methylase/tRNA (guanine6-N2)-methyltransferase
LSTDSTDVTLHFTSPPGLEDIVAAEYEGRVAALSRARGSTPVALSAERFDFRGELFVTVPEAAGVPCPELLEAARAMRSAATAMQLLRRTELPSQDALDALASALETVDVPGLADAPPFRVTGYRRGSHEFSRVDIQRVAGDVLARRYGAPVSLREYREEIVVTLYERRCCVLANLSRKPLDKRFHEPYHPRVASKATIAYAMLRLSGITEDTRPPHILDPFCGSGTMALEAAALRDDARISAMDFDERSARGTRENASHAGLEDRIEITQGDARKLQDRFASGSVDYIVTDPPYGVRSGTKMDFGGLYRGLLQGAEEVLSPSGRICLTVGRRRGIFIRVLGELGSFNVVHQRLLETGGMYPMIFVLERHR